MSDFAASYYESTAPGVGALPGRAHLDSTRAEASLDGPWRFRFAPSIAAAATDPAGESRPEAPADFADQVAVPGHWVLDPANGPLVLGEANRWGSPWYTNVQYPFPLDPPFVPDANGTGDYLREFTLAELGLDGNARDAERVLLRFEGVESTYKVWFNGIELGHATGSRLTHEFDLTAHLRSDGRNRLLVRVHQFSAASYIEDQDQWWLPGIFRSVTVIAQPRGGVWDVRSVASFRPEPGQHDVGAGRLEVEVDAAPEAFPLAIRVPELDATATIDAVDQPAGANSMVTGTAVLEVGGVHGWTAETPRLYRVEVASAAETVTLRTGFRTVAIEDGVLTVNGAPIRFKGVNRHEFHPRTGRTVTEEYTRSELALMKRHNINAIRTSHYPPDHHLIRLADELGFWVVDECDIETHGFGLVGWEANPSDDPAWRHAYLDRVERMWRRDANHPCIVMFSLGNEAGTGANLHAMADWLHEHDARPVHYEGDHDARYTDVYSRMYATPAEWEAIGRGEPVPSASAEGSAKILNQPYVLCEYVHAMGTGPGGIADYEAVFDAYPRAAGGFVWEWKDHGFAAQAADGTPAQAYGGDFAEPIHDANFVLDGLVFSDLTPTPGLIEYAKVIEPVRVRRAGDELEIVNRQDFADTSGFEFCARWQAGGGEAVQTVDVPPIPARSSARVPLPETLRGRLAGDAGGGLLTITVHTRHDAWWADTGHEVTWAQIEVGDPLPAPAPPAEGAGEQGADAEFDEHGLLCALAGVELAGPAVAAFRAPTDNDVACGEPARDLHPGHYGLIGIEPHAPDDFDFDAYSGTGPDGLTPLAEDWAAAGLHRLQRRTVAVEATSDVEPGALRVVQRYTAPQDRRGITVELQWTPESDGWLLEATLTADDVGVPLPLLGLDFQLPAGLLTDASDVSWTGAGPGERYADMGTAARLGTHRLPAAQLRTDYPKPQVSGRRGRLRDLSLGLADGRHLHVDVVRGPADTGFMLSPWSQQQLAAATHHALLPEPTAWHLTIDGGFHGLGTLSCGVAVSQEATFADRRVDLALRLRVTD